MAEKGFGVKEINLIGASGTPTIESPNNLNLNAVNVAISTNVSIGGTLSVTGNVSVGGTLTYEDVTNIDSVGVITARSGVVVGDTSNTTFKVHRTQGASNTNCGIDFNSGGSLNIFTGTSSGTSRITIDNTGNIQFSTFGSTYFLLEDYVTHAGDTNTQYGFNGADSYEVKTGGSTRLTVNNSGANVVGALTVNGSALSITPTTSDIQVAYELLSTSSSSNGYRISGNGTNSSTNNPDLYLIRGQKYRFINNSGGTHPFRIQSDTSSTLYSTGVTNNNASSGNIDFAPTYDSPAHLYYKCGNHPSMLGNIYIRGANGDNDNVGVTTFTGDLTIPDKIVHAGDSDTAIRFGNNQVLVEAGGHERIRIDQSKILKGLTSARGNYGNNTSGVEYGVQIEGTTALTSSISLVRNSNDANDGGIVLGKTRATSTGGNTVVQAGDDLGNLTFAGSDGTSLLFGAEIFAEVESGVGNDDMPAALVFKTNSGTTSTTERLRIHANGAVSIANTRNYYGALNVEAGVITSGASAIDVKASGTDKQIMSFGDHNTISGELRLTNSSHIALGTSSNHPFTFYINGHSNEVGRFGTNGEFLVGTTTRQSSTGIGIKLAMDATNPSVNTVINQSAGNHSFYHLYNTNGTHNAYRFYVQVNGGIANHSGNNVNLSDERMKKNITNMGSVYDTFKKFTFRDFNYIDDGVSDSKKHGVIAQEIEPIDPDLITEDFKIAPDSDGNDVYRKALKEEQFMMIGMKALQEAMSKIDALEAKVAALEGS